MFSKAFSKPIDPPMFSNSDDANIETTDCDRPIREDVLGDTPELINLPAERLDQHSAVVEIPHYDNMKDSLKEERDSLSTSLHTVDSQASIVLPISLARATNELENHDDLSFHASDVDSFGMKDDMAFASPQNERDGINGQGMSIHSLEAIAKTLEEQERHPKGEGATSEKLTNGMVRWTKVLLAFLAVLCVVAHCVLKKSMVENDASTNAIATNCTSPFSESNGKAISINIAAQGVSVQYRGNEAEIETYSLDSWEKLGTATLHTSWIAILTLLSFAKWMGRSRHCAKQVPSQLTVKNENLVGDFDLSAYNNFKYVELQDLLRQRGLKTSGKKPILVKRLVTVYNAELGTLTVVQLRKILKTRNYTQTGRKDEIIRTLVEAGPAL